ncbi:MAG: type IV pilus inner membrane component PilO [Syntrophales bacterium]
MAMNFDELNKLSPKMKILVVILACVLIGYFYYTLFLSDILTQKMDLGTKLTELQRQVADKEKAAAQLSKHLQEVNALKESFATALQKLPNEREIAGLLSAVVQSGKEAGVNFLLFEPKPPEKKAPQTKPAKPAPAAAPAAGQPPKPAEPEKFYEDIPIKVQLTGGFHNTVSFFEQVARLPRIVNVEDITMGESQDAKGRGRIVKTSCTVKTYMFVEKKK